MSVEQKPILLAFYPNARGFAFVVFEAPLSPIDWGITDLQRARKVERCLRRLQVLIDRYEPRTLVVRDMASADPRSIRLFEAIVRSAESMGVSVVAVSRRQIRQAFVHLASPSRSAIANALARQLPALAAFVPPARKIWNGEDRRMGLFDAAAMTVAYQAGC